jgi:hypothetical protein
MSHQLLALLLEVVLLLHQKEQLVLLLEVVLLLHQMGL